MKLNWKISVAAVAVVLIAHFIFNYLGLYQSWVNLDDIMHFVGGFTAAGIAVAIQGAFMSRQNVNLPLWYQILFVFGIVMFFGSFWELFEYSFDQLFAFWFNLLPLQPSIKDTMGDIILDFLGALTFVASYLLIFKRKINR